MNNLKVANNNTINDINEQNINNTNKDNKNDYTIVVDINNNYIDNYIDNNNVIYLSESSEDSNDKTNKTLINKKRTINLGKSLRPKKTKLTKDIAQTIYYNNTNTKEDTAKINNKENNADITKGKFSINRISYHCSNINGHYYKYLCEQFSSPNEIKFRCFNDKCKAWGIYDISDKTFTLREEHWFENSIDCYEMNEQDKNNLAYMKNNKIDEIQMYNDVHD